ncbi:hypothetical protein BDZ97DRAFT_1663142 [Flammula alnicola]|nr:hypothetical protein BDZ97DRAFT_1663142 [Flammula alnicola]
MTLSTSPRSAIVKKWQHPTSPQVQMLSDPSKLEWKLQGQIVMIPDLPLNLLVSTLCNCILQHMQSMVPASRIWSLWLGKMLMNKKLITASNLEDEDMLVFSVHDPKKK